jgi:propanol-preferring alcohol dehydrogenase
MKALQLVRWGQRAQLVDVPIPEPGPGQVVLRVAAAGACHSDLHLMDWPEGQLPWKLPFTIGHENAGHVHALGAGVTGFREGDAVVVHGPWGCGYCRACRLGRENYCAHAAEISAGGGGLGLDGGMAEYMLVPSPRHLIPLGALDPIVAAPLADAGLTPYHAIRAAAPLLVPGSVTVVIGAGGLGQLAVQLLRATTATRVIAVDRDDATLEWIRSRGAHAAIRSDAGAADGVRKLTDQAGVELVLDMVGNEQTLALGARVLRPEGRLVIIGLGLGTLPVNFFALPYGAQVMTSYWGTATELMELVALAVASRIHLETERFSLDRAPEAYDRLRRGDVRGRAVIVP